jgi:molecular chaperone GrpE
MSGVNFQMIGEKMSDETEVTADEILVNGGFDPETGVSTDPEFDQEKVVNALQSFITENAELKDRLLRMAAEMENLRTRTARDVRDARSFAVTNFARDMLSIGDNLNRAMEMFSSEARANADCSLLALLEGVELTERAFETTLERHGVKKIFPEGQKFDPNFHQAMFEVPNSDVPNNTVVQVVQAGYTIVERVLRPAMVGVSKGGLKLTETASE